MLRQKSPNQIKIKKYHQNQKPFLFFVTQLLATISIKINFSLFVFIFLSAVQTILHPNLFFASFNAFILVLVKHPFNLARNTYFIPIVLHRPISLGEISKSISIYKSIYNYFIGVFVLLFLYTMYENIFSLLTRDDISQLFQSILKLSF